MKAATLALLTLVALQPAPPDVLLAKLDAYLARYELGLSELIADEAMSQELRYPSAYAQRREAPGQGFRTRRLNSEVAFIALPGEAGWMGFRHVKSVDRTAVEDAESLTTALSGSSLDPTLIQHPDGGNQPSHVRAWIDPRDGRLLRAEVVTFTDLTAKRSDHSIRVEFDQDRRLGLLVPREMREKFPDFGGRGTSSAVYSNYRRFTTSARIVPQ